VPEDKGADEEGVDPNRKHYEGVHHNQEALAAVEGVVDA